MTCATCLHFLRGGREEANSDPRDRTPNQTLGACRRFPPRQATGASRWPTVNEKQRCGEFVSASGSPC